MRPRGSAALPWGRLGGTPRPTGETARLPLQTMAEPMREATGVSLPRRAEATGVSLPREGGRNGRDAGCIGFETFLIQNLDKN